MNIHGLGEEGGLDLVILRKAGTVDCLEIGKGSQQEGGIVGPTTARVETQPRNCNISTFTLLNT